MTRALPDYGPQEIQPCDGIGEPFAVVRLALTLTRQQMRAALATGHAEQAGEPPLDEMQAADIRREIEGYFAAAAISGSAAHIATVTAALGARLAADLDNALNRAYQPEPRPLPAVRAQDPRYRDGTVTLQTLDHGEVTVDEPAWCIGHDDDTIDYLAGITHHSRTCATTAITAEVGEVNVARAQISHGPHLVKQPEPYPTLHITLDLDQSFNPEDGRAVTRAMRVAAGRIDRQLEELEAIRRAGR